MLAAGQGTVSSSFQQRSVEGEQHAILYGSTAAEPGCGIQSDCAAAIATNRKPYVVAAGPKAQFAGYRRDKAKGLGTRGQRHGLSKTKAHRNKREIEHLPVEEKQHWQGNGVVDSLAKAAVTWHATDAATCSAMEKETLWKVKVIKSIGKMLAALPNARELYEGHVWTEEAEQAGPAMGLAWEVEEEEDVFGHGAAGMDDPEANLDQGLHAKEDYAQPEDTTIPSAEGHDWVWTGKAWQCFCCLRLVRDRRTNKTPCRGIPISLKEAFTEGKKHEHRLQAARDSRQCWVCWCSVCGSWAASKAINLKYDCEPPKKQGKIVLSRVSKQLHPDGTKVALGPPQSLGELRIPRQQVLAAEMAELDVCSQQR